jgi:hypothetical protein
LLFWQTTPENENEFYCEKSWQNYEAFSSFLSLKFLDGKEEMQ